MSAQRTKYDDSGRLNGGGFLTRNRDRTPEDVLQGLITALETPDDETDLDGSRTYGPALEHFRQSGPLSVAADPAGARDYLTVRAELLAFLRDIVRHGRIGREPHYGIGTYGFFNFNAQLEDGSVTCRVGGEWRDTIVLQLIVLLQNVGMTNVRLCAAPDCGRIFIKTYRRTFCSATCQTRVNKRVQRQNQKEKVARRRLRQRRQRAT